MTLQELKSEVKDRKIISIEMKDGKKYRPFVSGETLCYFKERSGRRGYPLFINMDEIKTIKYEKVLSDEDKLKKQYSEIAKYKKMAKEASFTNRFIKDCKNIPEFEEWKKDKVKSSWDEKSEPRPKGLFELGITTGNKIDGKVISLSRIAKQYPRYIERLREAIKTQTASDICHAVPFAGYDMSLSTQNIEGAVGEFMGYLSLEYKGCGNGYYYLLINDENFIGYDVD